MDRQLFFWNSCDIIQLSLNSNMYYLSLDEFNLTTTCIYLYITGLLDNRYVHNDLINADNKK